MNSTAAGWLWTAARQRPAGFQWILVQRMVICVIILFYYNLTFVTNIVHIIFHTQLEDVLFCMCM